MKFKPLINGKSYGWADITLNVMGVPVAGVTSIEYSETEDMANLPGAGKFPVSRGYGAVTYAGSITLMMEEVVALEQASPTGRIQDIPEFPIIVSYLPENGNLVTHTLKMCRFKDNKKAPRTGDLGIEQQIELLIGEIKWK